MWRTASVLVGVSLILAAFGLIMLTSTSADHAVRTVGDPMFFVKRQALWLAVALIVGYVISRVDAQIWNQLAIPMLGVSVILLVLALVPGIGMRIGGSNRWVRIGPINFQPSEFAKLAIIASVAWYFSRNQRRADELLRGLLVPLFIMGIPVGLIFISPDFGTTFLIMAVGMIIMFAGGTRISHLVVTAILGLSAFILAVLHDPVRMRRLTAFLNPEKYAEDEAYQLLNAIYAFVIGGGRGVGLGGSIQKRLYLPESHTDFIFAIIGEELGIAASVGVVLAYVVFFAAGMRVAMLTQDVAARLLALGITLMITFQAAFNIAVVVGVVPTKGLALPLISYGGSSIVMTMAMVGILVSIALNEERVADR